MNSIVDERVVSFINSFKKDDSTICQEIEKEARESYVPIIRKEMAEFLKTILAIKNPLNILEIGTAVGYSAILMSENISPKARITTIENYDVRIPIARNNFVRAGKREGKRYGNRGDYQQVGGEGHQAHLQPDFGDEGLGERRESAESEGPGAEDGIDG